MAARPEPATATAGLARLTLTAAQRAEIVAHASAGRPNEACGLLAGNDERVEHVYRLANADASPMTYRLDSREQFAAFNDAERRGLDVVGCFHSHVGSPARPSATDIRQAFYPEWAYVIVGLAGDEPDVRAYRIVDGTVDEIPVVSES